MTSHSLFFPPPTAWISVMGAYKLNQPKKRKKIQWLQSKTLRKILLKKQQDFIKQYSKELEILKFSDLLYMQNYLFLPQIETNKKN